MAHARIPYPYATGTHRQAQGAGGGEPDKLALSLLCPPAAVRYFTWNQPTQQRPCLLSRGVRDGDDGSLLLEICPNTPPLRLTIAATLEAPGGLIKRDSTFSDTTAPKPQMELRYRFVIASRDVETLVHDNHHL